MNLPADFHFTSSNLQDYLSCERRFELKAIQQRLWPALPSQPVQDQEELMRNGVLFHQFINQYFLGISPAMITTLIQNTSMLQWWNNFLTAFGPDIKMGFIAFEFTLAGFINQFPVLSKLDAIRVRADQWMIYDWKTGLHLPKPQTMQQKIQSHLYPYMLSKYGANLNKNHPIPPDQISMVYWFPEHPTQEITFQYSSEKYAQDEQYLNQLMQEISGKVTGDFALTTDEKNCLFCVYRSLCGRGTIAGNFSVYDTNEESIEDLDAMLQSLDMDQMTEIAF